MLAILEHDEGMPIVGIARRFGVSRQTVHDWIARFEERRCADDLREVPRPGRPARLGEAFDVVLEVLLMLLPERFGYHATHWTVRLLRDQLRRNLEQDCSEGTIRRELHRLGYVWKRPSYVLAPDPEREKKTPHSPHPVWLAKTQRRVGGG